MGNHLGRAITWVGQTVPGGRQEWDCQKLEGQSTPSQLDTHHELGSVDACIGWCRLCTHALQTTAI